MKEPLIFITSHAAKAEQVSWHLNHPVVHQKLDIPEIQSLDPVEVVTHKAKEAYRQMQKPVLVEDISVRFAALGKLPGTLIKWFLAELGPQGLCKLLDGYEARNATVEPYFALCTGDEVEIFSAAIGGEIAASPRGDAGFGMDSIFVPQGHTKTWGEMTKEEQIATSVRRIALQKLEAYLREKSQN